MKFKELSPMAQIKAMKDYIAGWEETHSKGDLTRDVAWNLLIDSEDVFDIAGNYIDSDQ
jgi:hypothetical protein